MAQTRELAFDLPSLMATEQTAAGIRHRGGKGRKPVDVPESPEAGFGEPQK